VILQRVRKILQTFVNDNPKYPLVVEAKQVVAEIGGYTCKKDNAAVAC